MLPHAHGPNAGRHLPLKKKKSDIQHVCMLACLTKAGLLAGFCQTSILEAADRLPLSTLMQWQKALIGVLWKDGHPAVRTQDRCTMSDF